MQTAHSTFAFYFYFYYAAALARGRIVTPNE
jgi:hypothetical protein